MKFESIELSSICRTNAYSYSQNDNWQFVNYLDTGNITQNKISEIQHIDLQSEKLPNRAKRKVKHDSILFSTVRPNQLHYGIIKSQPENFLVSTGFAVIDIDQTKAVADFIYYYLIQKDIIQHLQAIAEQSTSAYPSIKPSDIENLIINIPDLKTQNRIAAVLSALDDKIELNNKINENLEQQAQAIFKSWFVDFEPFGGKMPAEWKETELGEIAEISSGKRPAMKQSTKTNDVCIPLVGAASVMGYTNKSNYNDKILVTGRVGTHGVIQRFNSPCWASDNTLVIESGCYEYVYQILQCIDYKNLNRGSTQPLITQSDLKKTSIILPTNNILQKFENIVCSLMAVNEQNQQENARLSVLRDTLLPKLMNGEIDVCNVCV